jgi:hypothetical protein
MEADKVWRGGANAGDAGGVAAARDEALLDAARAVDRVLHETGALEGSSIHSALSAARHAVLCLRSPHPIPGEK